MAALTQQQMEYNQFLQNQAINNGSGADTQNQSKVPIYNNGTNQQNQQYQNTANGSGADTQNKNSSASNDAQNYANTGAGGSKSTSTDSAASNYAPVVIHDDGQGHVTMQGPNGTYMVNTGYGSSTAVNNQNSQVDQFGSIGGSFVAEQTDNIGSNNQAVQNYGAQVYNLDNMPNEGAGFDGTPDLNPNWLHNSAAEQIDALNNERLHWNINGAALQAPHYDPPRLPGFTTDDSFRDGSGNSSTSDYQDQPFAKRQKKMLQDPSNQQAMNQHGFDLSDAGTGVLEAYASYKTISGGISNFRNAVETVQGEGETFANAGQSLIDKVVGKAAGADETIAEYGGEEMFGEGGLTALAEGGAATLGEIGLDAAVIGGFVAGGEVIAAGALIGFGLYEGYKAVGGTAFGAEVEQDLGQAKGVFSGFDSFAKSIFG